MGSSMDDDGGARLSWHGPADDEDAGVDPQVREWERGLTKARGRTRATIWGLSVAAIVALSGGFLYANAPPVRTSLHELVGSHAVSGSVAMGEPAAVAPLPSELWPSAPPVLALGPPDAAALAVPAEARPPEPPPMKAIAKAKRTGGATNHAAKARTAVSRRLAPDDIYSQAPSAPARGAVARGFPAMNAGPSNAPPAHDPPRRRDSPPSRQLSGEL